MAKKGKARRHALAGQGRSRPGQCAKFMRKRAKMGKQEARTKNTRTRPNTQAKSLVFRRVQHSNWLAK